jgi:biotin carboxyl carrier protein
MNPSPKRLELTIDGSPYVVEIDDLKQSPLTVRVNGQEYLVQLESDGAGRPAVIEPMPDQPGQAASSAAPSSRAVRPSPLAASGNEIVAPMPGDILDIQVAPGDQVQVGDQICSLEAMKMKSAIRSARAGTIAAVEVSDGQAVAHGDVLVRFE